MSSSTASWPLSNYKKLQKLSLILKFQTTKNSKVLYPINVTKIYYFNAKKIEPV